MDREQIMFAALKPMDMALGAVVGALKATRQVDRVTDGFYAVTRDVLRRMFEGQNDLTVEGLDNVPAQGGVLFAINHQSWSDVQVVGASCPRRVRFLAKAEFQDWPILRHLIVLSDSPFIKRGGDVEGMQSAVQALREGRCLAIFPEGTIPGEEAVSRHEVEPDTGLLRGRTGAVRMALAAGVPIVPVGVSGTGASFPPEVYPRLEILQPPRNVPITLRYGRPINFEGWEGKTPTREDLHALTKELMLAISALVDHDRNFIPLTVPVPPLPKVERLGVLLLHGFTNSPKSMEGLVSRLDEAGVRYSRPILRGHGGLPSDLVGVTAQDWYDDAQEALEDLAQEVDKVVVVGSSMGGLLAINLGIRYPDVVAGVVTMAASLLFRNPLVPAAPALARLARDWRVPSAFNDPDHALESEDYPRFPTDALVSLLRYAKETGKRLPQLRAPICVLQSRRDQIVSPVAANIIYRDVSSTHREIHWFERSGHELAQDLEQDQVHRTVMAFIQQFVPTRQETAASDG